MKIEELVILLPCHSLEDFPLYYDGEAAEGLLSAWSALWHPVLIAQAGSPPTWYRADSPPSNLENRLIIVPEASDDRLSHGFLDHARGAGSTVISGVVRRDDAVAAALAAGAESQQVNADLAADFMALAFCRLQVELLTRHMRYTSSVDEDAFRRELLLAAEAAVRQDDGAAEMHLAQCFELLYTARKYFYPVDAYLIDYTLTAPGTLGSALERELRQPVETNVLIAGATLGELFRTAPATADALSAALRSGITSLVGGEYEELELPFLPLETIYDQFAAGLKEYERLLEQRPVVFGRRLFGLSPLLPQILSKLGFQGAMHVTLDDGRFPTSPQSKTRWEGLDFSAIDALVRIPRDAAKHEEFLQYSRTMGESMELDHVATVVWAHWPGTACCWYEDMRRIARYSPVLGKFVTLESYFGNTELPGRMSKFGVDEYRAPYLRQAVAARTSDPISRFVRLHRVRAMQDATHTLNTLSALLGKPASCNDAATPGDLVGAREHGEEATSPALETAAANLAAVIAGGEQLKTPGYLVLNPLSFPRRVVATLKPPAATAQDNPEDPADDVATTVVDVPAMGFAWIGAQGAPPKPRRRALAEDNVLRSEHVELTVNPTTGAIQSIFSPGYRGNRLSQQLAFRFPAAPPEPGSLWEDPDKQARYTVMAADAIEARDSGPDVGELHVRGRLVDRDGRRVAGFTQVIHLAADSRLVTLDIELDPADEPGPDPWTSYYAARFAWPASVDEIRRSVGLGAHATTATKIEAPLFVEIGTERARTAILSGGMPYHRRTGERTLDTLLLVRGEAARRFRMGIGVNVPDPAQASFELLAPSIVVGMPAPPAAESGWLFHLSSRNLVATNWEPICARPGGQPAEAASGIRVRLAETAGLAGKAVLRCFRPVAAARQVDFQGQTLITLSTESDKITLDYAPYEWMEVEALWDV